MVNGTLMIQMARLWRRKWIVVVTAMLFLLTGVALVLAQSTSYSAKATLAVVSQNRAPEQDAILAQGYVNFFNDPAFQEALRQRAKVTSDVVVEAETAAASPLLYITASSSDRATVSSAAADMAKALRETVNDAIRAGQDDAIAKVRESYQTPPAGAAIPEQIRIQMEDRISALNADNTNKLEVVELESGITSTTPSPAQVLGLALFGGLVMGCAIALVMGSLTRRIDSEFELSSRCNVPVLAVIPSEASARAQRLKQLAHALTRSVRPAPTVLAISPVETTAAWSIARALARYRSDQGARVLVVDADLSMRGEVPGFADYLRSSEGIDLDQFVRPTSQPGLSELGRGVAVEEVGAVSFEQVERLVVEMRDRADFVVIVTPSVVERADAQIMCAASDSVLLVTEQQVTRITSVLGATRLIEQVDGRLAGAVLLEKGVAAAERSSSGRDANISGDRSPASATPESRDYLVVDPEHGAHATPHSPRS